MSQTEILELFKLFQGLNLNRASYSAVKTCEKHYCHCFGSFGNIALPNDSAAVIELQWWERDIRDEAEEKSEKKSEKK